jgi:hypothetical protein
MLNIIFLTQRGAKVSAEGRGEERRKRGREEEEERRRELYDNIFSPCSLPLFLFLAAREFCPIAFVGF